jgi:hypothetical protein
MLREEMIREAPAYAVYVFPNVEKGTGERHND